MRIISCLVLVVVTAGFLHAQDKTLDYYINAGLQTSPLLKDYANQVQINRIDSARIAAGYKPQVNAVSTNLYAPVIGGVGYDGAITNFANFSEVVAATKQIVSKANLNNQYSAVRLASDSVRNASKISEQDLKKTITTQYIIAFGSWQQYQFNRDVFNLLAHEDTLLKRLAQATVYRQTDYLTFLVTLQQQKLAVTGARNQYQADFAMLNYVSGLFDTSFVPLTPPGLELNNILEADNTVFYDKFRIDSLLLRNADAQIDFNYKPKLNLYADAGYVSSFAYEAYKNFGTSFGVNLSVPIYDGKQRKMQHNKIAIADQTRKEYQNFFVTQYNQQLAQLAQQLRNTQQLINETQDVLKYVESLIQANAKLLATGDVHIADYVIAINNYLNAKNIILQNTVNKLQIINQINYWNRK
jgi:outer membrane protein TolC